jgi:phage terminase large subunit-like protein
VIRSKTICSPALTDPENKTPAGRVCQFIEKYCLVPEGALVGKPIKLLQFQIDFIEAVYNNPSGTSRAYLSIARKNGKSSLIAAIALAHIVGPQASGGRMACITPDQPSGLRPSQSCHAGGPNFGHGSVPGVGAGTS